MRRWSRLRIGALVLGWNLMSCGPAPEQPESPASSPGGRLEISADSSAPLVVFLGDSLTAGMGVAESEAFPALLGERLAAAGTEIRVVNAGISGDTTAGGLARLDWLLAQQPAVMVLELGANDGLRGLQLLETEENLSEIIRRSLESGARVLLLGMKIPPSYGPEYSLEFEQLFEDLARAHGIGWMPFLLEGVAAIPELNQADGIHPNVAGQEILARNVLPYLQKMLE